LLDCGVAVVCGGGVEVEVEEVEEVEAEVEIEVGTLEVLGQRAYEW